ncbi:MAG: PEP-CTERM sorting domain-containing protein [Myxococcota bacterium]
MTIDSATSTLTDAQICASPTVLSCLVPLLDLNGSPNIAAGGTLDIAGGTLTFSFSLPIATLSGSDGAVVGASLTNVTYQGTFGVTLSGGNRYQYQDQLTSISGTLTPVGAGAAAGFANAAVNTTGECVGTPGTSFICSFLFGPVGADVDVNGNTRYLRQSVNLTVIPEPGTAVLLGLGLAAIATTGRRR